MFRYGLIALFSLTVVSLSAAEITLAPAWSTYVGDSYSKGDGVTSLAAEKDGTLYGAGYFGQEWYAIENNVAYVLQEFGSKGGEDHLIFSVTADGRLQWATALGNSEGDERAYGTAVTPDQLYVAGTQYPSSSYPRECTFGVVYSFNKHTGSPIWTKPPLIGQTLGTTNALLAVVAMPDGGGVAVGYTSSSDEGLNVEPVSINGVAYGMTFQGGLDALAVRFNSEGSILWKRYLGGRSHDQAYACAADDQGNLYIAGETFSSGWATIDSGEPTPTRPSGFFTKLAPDGRHLWTRYLCGNGSVSIRGVGVSPTENALYLVGRTTTGVLNQLGTACSVKNSFGGVRDGFLLKCVLSGESEPSPSWLRFIGGNGADSATGVSFDAKGHPVVCGEAGNEFFQPADGSPYGGTEDGYAFLFPTDGGEPLWKAYAGGVVEEHAFAVVATPVGVTVAGTTRSQGWIHGGFWTDGTRRHEDSTPYPPGDGPTFGFLCSWQMPKPPVLEEDLSDLTVVDGAPATFSVTAGGSQPLYYYWFRNGEEPAYPVTDPTYTIPSVKMTDNGMRVRCVVSNQTDAVSTRIALLTVTNAVPVITTQPQDRKVLDGSPVEFSIVASAGSALPDFQWYRNGAKISDAVSQILSLPKVGVADSGTRFFCVVSNPSGVVTSKVAMLQVDGLIPTIVSHPKPITVQEGKSATFSVEASGGSSALTYIWYRDQKTIPGANAASYTFVTSLKDNGAQFSCEVSNPSGTVKSHPALLTVTEKPKGTLAVTLSPDPALVRGAAWSIDQGETWLGSGSSLDLREGHYAVSFKPVEAFLTPAATNLLVTSGETTALTVRYTPIAVSSSVLRSIAATNITLEITPPPGTPFWGITEHLPKGVTVVDPAGGYWDAGSRQLTFTGVVSTRVTYTVSTEGVGPYAFTGTFYPYGGIEEVVGGDAELSLSSAIRSVSSNRVTIQVAPPPGTKPFVWALEEQLPPDVIPTDLQGPGASWDPANRTLTWVMMGGTPASCAYTLTGQPGTYSVSGRVTFGEDYDPVTGISQVIIPDQKPEPPFEIPVPEILSFTRNSANHWSLLFLSTQNVVYAVQTNQNLSSGTWGTLFTLPGEPEQTRAEFDLKEPQLFLRVKAEAPQAVR